MNKERFKSTLDEGTMSIMPYLVFDKEEECFYNLESCVDLLNAMSDEIEEVGISIKLFEEDVQIKDKKIEEQQAIIDKQELRLQCIEELLELSKNLNKSYREKLIDMNLKMVIDDE